MRNTAAGREAMGQHMALYRIYGEAPQGGQLVEQHITRLTNQTATQLRAINYEALDVGNINDRLHDYVEALKQHVEQHRQQ